jgi:hypothetical protein
LYWPAGTEKNEQIGSTRTKNSTDLTNTVLRLCLFIFHLNNPNVVTAFPATVQIISNKNSLIYKKLFEDLAAKEFFLKFSSTKSIHFELLLEKCSIHGRKIYRLNESRKPRRDETNWEYLMKVRRILLKRMSKKYDMIV